VVVIMVVGVFVGVVAVLGSVGVVLVLLEDLGWHYGGYGAPRCQCLVVAERAFV